MSLILLRHTRPAIPEGICYGRTDLAPGADFEATAAALAATLPAVAAIRSSPLTRCLRLAERIASARGLALEIDPLLIEMDFGSWETRPWTAIDRTELDAWAADFDHARPHGGESVAMLASRVGAALDASPPADPPVLWVTHSGVIRAACALTGAGEGWSTETGFAEWRALSSREARPAPPPRVR